MHQLIPYRPGNPFTFLHQQLQTSCLTPNNEKCIKSAISYERGAFN